MIRARDKARQQRIRNFIRDRLDSNQGLITRPRLQMEIKNQLGLVIKRHALDKLLKLDLRLVWKRVRPQYGYVNSQKNIVLRQVFAITLLKTLLNGKKMINIDETCITATRKHAYSYGRRGESCTRYFNRNVQGLSLLLAVS